MHGPRAHSPSANGSRQDVLFDGLIAHQISSLTDPNAQESLNTNHVSLFTKPACRRISCVLISFPSESNVDERGETQIRPRLCLQAPPTLPTELALGSSQTPSLHHTYIQTHHEPETLCGHTCANTCAQRPCVNHASHNRNTFGIHSEYIRSTVGVHSEDGKTYHFVTSAFLKIKNNLDHSF